MIDPMTLIAACEACYEHADITGGPDGRDGASVSQLPTGETLLVFRGTLCRGEVGFIDWINDFYAELVERPEYSGKVHKGFADSLADLWSKLPTLTPPVVIVGHSKGGALATLATERLFRRGGDWRKPGSVSLTSFASPKAGDSVFAASPAFFYAVRQAVRYENTHDIVPKLPPWNYCPAGRIEVPYDWTPPHGICANHELSTGYKPWIALSQQLKTQAS